MFFRKQNLRPSFFSLRTIKKKNKEESTAAE